jgi:hypothetical protein
MKNKRVIEVENLTIDDLENRGWSKSEDYENVKRKVNEKKNKTINIQNLNQ